MRRQKLGVLRGVVLGAVVAGAASASFGQVIFAPVQYQYDASGNGNRFYYGGSDPTVFRLATRASIDPAFGRVGGFGFVSSRRVVTSDPAPAYSDAFPGINLTPFGYTPTDAMNAAYRNTPTYFRKADLLRSAETLPDGSRVVPSNAPVMSIVSTSSSPRVAPGANLTKGVIIIIPTKRPAAKATRVVADAR